MNHTKEPWNKVFLNNHWHITRTDGRIEIAKVSAYKVREHSTANANRIVACVNACAGIEDPEAAIRTAKKAMKSFINEWSLIEDDFRGTPLEGVRDEIVEALKLLGEKV